ncbi:MAG: YcfL family protein [Hydrogenophilales bacterium]
MRIFPLISILLLFFLVSSCATKRPLLPYEMCPGYSELGSQKKLIKSKVKYLDDVNVDIVQLRCLTAENGLMIVDIDFENNYRKKQQAEFLVSWYENNGMAAETDPNWRMLILYPDEKRTMKLIAPNKSAKDFTIQIK